MNIILVYFAIKYKGDWDAIYKALENKEKVSHDDIKALEEKLETEKWKFITIVDGNYPDKLKQAYKPPFCIFVKGDTELFKQKMIVASGDIAKGQTFEYINQSLEAIEKNHFIINPFFKGIDQYVYKNHKKPSVYVLSCGIDKIPEYLNATEKDLLVTEYPYGTSPKKDYFRNRNRIIASLSENLILYSTEKNSKINHLVNEFLNLGKDIFCFPGSGNEEEGNFDFIKQGARLITRVVDMQ